MMSIRFTSKRLIPTFPAPDTIHIITASTARPIVVTWRRVTGATCGSLRFVIKCAGTRARGSRTVQFVWKWFTVAAAWGLYLVLATSIWNICVRKASVVTGLDKIKIIKVSTKFETIFSSVLGKLEGNVREYRGSGCVTHWTPWATDHTRVSTRHALVIACSVDFHGPCKRQEKQHLSPTSLCLNLWWHLTRDSFQKRRLGNFGW